MDKNEKSPEIVRTPENMVIYDPEKPLYQRLHICIHLRELLDRAEEEAKRKEAESVKEEDK